MADGSLTVEPPWFKITSLLVFLCRTGKVFYIQESLGGESNLVNCRLLAVMLLKKPNG